MLAGVKGSTQPQFLSQSTIRSNDENTFSIDRSNLDAETETRRVVIARNDEYSLVATNGTRSAEARRRSVGGLRLGISRSGVQLSVTLPD